MKETEREKETEEKEKETYRVCEKERGRRGERKLHATNHSTIGQIRLDVDAIARDMGVKCPPVIGRVVPWSLCAVDLRLAARLSPEFRPAREKLSPRYRKKREKD